MTGYEEGSRSGSRDRDGFELDKESSLEFSELIRSTPPPIFVAGNSRCWYVKGTLEIYRKNVQQNDRGYLTWTIF